MSENDIVIEAWNTVLFDKFLRFKHLLVAGLAGHSDEVLSRHPFPAGSRVLDVGCGFGDSTLRIAREVGSDGAAVGTDCAARFIASCEQDAREQGVPNASFFVADSQWDRLKENVESYRNLEENMREYNYNLDEMPYVIQYNKRDLANIAPIEYMEFMLNRRTRQVPYFEAVAVNGDGVFDTLNTVSRMVLVGEFGQEKGEHRETA